VKELIRKLTEAYGPSGREAAVRDIIRAEIGKAVETRVDAMGSLIAHRPGKGGRRVMLASHMDEIGVVVTHVDQKGFLRFGNVGGVRPMPLAGSRIQFANGVTGVIGMEKLEDPNKVPGMDKFYIDVGADESAPPKVKVGDIACFARPFEELGGRLVAKAMDDRIGCAILIQLLKELKKSPHDIFFVFTVQEEVGLRGAATSAFGVEPDLALAVDITLTGDTPECPPMAVRLGGGPAIKVKDSGMIAHGGVKDWLVRTAEISTIPFQLEVLTGGSTDAMAMQTSRAGVPAGCVSIPTRYAHSPSEMIDYGDVQNTVKLLQAALSAPIDIG
jgi:putative aminopeptidase FrvX